MIGGNDFNPFFGNRDLRVGARFTEEAQLFAEPSKRLSVQGIRIFQFEREQNRAGGTGKLGIAAFPT